MNKSGKDLLIFKEKITQKRRDTNPYISKVENDKDIIIDEKIIFEKTGKWNNFFGNKNNIILEIGTGFGNFFSEEVVKNPKNNFIGLELKYKRLFYSAEKCRKKTNIYYSEQYSSLNGKNKNLFKKYTLKIKESLSKFLKGKNNFVLLKTKGENIDKFLSDSEISKTYIFFPDPWGKKDKQKKHRIFSEKFIKDLYNKTKKNGKLVFKTDHREYFDTTLELFEKIGLWKIILKSYDYKSDNINYDKTKKTEFETIFNEKKVCYIKFKK